MSVESLQRDHEAAIVARTLLRMFADCAGRDAAKQVGVVAASFLTYHAQGYNEGSTRAAYTNAAHSIDSALEEMAGDDARNGAQYVTGYSTQEKVA
jgi:hypothetical protein